MDGLYDLNEAKLLVLEGGGVFLLNESGNLERHLETFSFLDFAVTRRTFHQP